MFAILLSWIIITFVFLSFGNMAISAYNRLILSKTKYIISDVFFIGMAFTATTIAICSLWMPANIFLLGILILLSIVYWIFNRQKLGDIYDTYRLRLKNLPWYYLSILIIVVLLMALFSTLAPQQVDTQFYHIQSVMWNEEYSIVPGLGNLQPRFGFNSNYYLICSVFGLKPLFGHFLFGAHTLCATVVLCWIFYKARTASVAQMVVSFLIIGCFLIVYKLHFTSPSSDLMPNLLLIYITCRILFNKETLLSQPFTIFVLAAFCITLKVSVFPIILLCFYILYFLLKDKEYKSIGLLLSVGLLIGIPWCIRTVILTGYLVFPFPDIDLFDFDWKLPLAYATDQRDFIKSFARVDYYYTMEETLKMSFIEWFPKWWNSGMFYFTGYSNRFFFFALLISIPTTVGLFFSKRLRNECGTVFLIWIVNLVGILVWFFNAPDFRFAYGFILGLVFVTLYLLIYRLKDAKIEFLRQPLIIISFLFVCLHAGRWVYFQRDTNYSWGYMMYKPLSIESTIALREGRLGEKIEYRLQKVNNVEIYHSVLNEILCYDCPLPCSLDYVGGIEMRGETLQEGFRCRKDAPYRKTFLEPYK